MAQFYTNFSKKTLAQAPSEWTPRWNTANSVWSMVQSGVNKLLRHNQTVADERIISWNKVASVANIEVYVKCRTNSNTGYQNTIFVRANTNSASKHAYYLTMNETAGQKRIMIEQWHNGNYLYWHHVNYNWVANTWYKMRYRVQGNWHYVKIWPADQNEPTAWTFSRQDTTGTQHNGAGLFALGGYTNAGNRDWAEVGIGTNGDAAPTSALINTRLVSGFARKVEKAWNGSAFVPGTRRVWDGNWWVSGD